MEIQRRWGPGGVDAAVDSQWSLVQIQVHLMNGERLFAGDAAEVIIGRDGIAQFDASNSSVANCEMTFPGGPLRAAGADNVGIGPAAPANATPG